jgi:hypothetical protein
MFGSAILEAAIGLILIYLFLSLVVTAVQEAIAAHLRWRAENLYDGVRELLCDPKDKQGFAEKIYEHPLIYSLSKGPEGKPSYIPSRTFALALLDLIHPTDATQPRELATIRTAIKKLPPALQQSLTVLLDESGDNLERFKVEIEEWFNGSMERVSGWYKRHSQAMLLWLAIGTVVLFNVDSLELAHRLMRDPALRSALVAQAEQAAKVPSAAPPNGVPAASATGAEAAAAAAHTHAQEALANFDRLNLPVGWGHVQLVAETSAATLGLWLSRLCGWVLTAFAVSLGAPFWFDLLKRIINIRSAGKAPEERPIDPKTVPQPLAPGAGPESGAARRSQPG